MELRITRLDPELPMPKYETLGACAFDVMSRETMTIPPNGLALVPTGLVVSVPAGHVLLLASRSSTPRKKSLFTPHGFGLIDQDFCGPSDELLVQVWNYSDKPVTVERGERIAQAMIVPMVRCELTESVLATAESRGGFGSTG